MEAPNFADKTVWTGDNLDILRSLNPSPQQPDHRHLHRRALRRLPQPLA